MGSGLGQFTDVDLVSASRPSSGIEFLLLGPLEVRVSGQPVPINGWRQRVVLAVLLLEAGRVVPRERIVTAVWDDDPPPTARTQTQISISKLRARLAELGLPDAIETHDSGYRLRAPDGALDLTRFTRLVAAGRAAARAERRVGAAAMLREALGIWRGDAVAGIRSRLVQSVALRLDEERIAVTEDCVDLELAVGRHREVVHELRALVTAYPLRERLYSQLMLALYRAGRQAEALEVYREARRVLVEEHGLDPSDSLRELERAILDADPAVASPVTSSERAVPRQLPAEPKGFIGRKATVDDIVDNLTRGAASDLVAVTGPAGVGKTALALHVAYRVSDQFPDGQLFARLRGSDARPTAPEQVLDYFLRALGVPPSTLPNDWEALAGLYRSQLAGLRLLIVLDDAAGAWQVERLLPGAPGVRLIVTSRGSLPGLPGARRFDLDIFSAQASRELLTSVLGHRRVAAEPDAAAAVAHCCGHLPLALQIVAAKLSVREHWRIARMADRLGDESRRLDELSLDGTGVRASIAVSYQALGKDARRLLLMLGTLGPADFGSWVAGPLLDLNPYDGADLLDELVDARLVEVQSGGGYRTRYRLHDLVGVFARELLAEQVPTADRAGAQERLLRCWLFLARQAYQREYGGDFTVLHSSASHWPLPEPMVAELIEDPMAWFECEHGNLVAAVRLAGELDHYEVCWDLAVTLVTLFENRSYREDWRETHEVALHAVTRHADRRAEAAVRCSRAGLALVEHRFADASADLEAALAWFAPAGDRHGQGLALRGIASIDRLQGRYAQAHERYRRALADLNAVGDRIGEAHVLINLAQIHAEDGGLADAEQLLRQALEICTKAGARRVTAQTRHRLGQFYLGKGALADAEAEFAAVLGSSASADDPLGQAYALLGIGAVQRNRREYDAAWTSISEALAKMRQGGSRIGEGQALLALAELKLDAGRFSDARQRLDEAGEIFTRLGAAGWRERAEELREGLPPGGSARPG